MTSEYVGSFKKKEEEEKRQRKGDIERWIKLQRDIKIGREKEKQKKRAGKISKERKIQRERKTGSERHCVEYMIFKQTGIKIDRRVFGMIFTKKQTKK